MGLFDCEAGGAKVPRDYECCESENQDPWPEPIRRREEAQGREYAARESESIEDRRHCGTFGTEPPRQGDDSREVSEQFN